MSAIIIILVIWCIIAFLYSKAKGIGFWEANKNLLNSLIKHSAERKNSIIKDYKRKNK